MARVKTPQPCELCGEMFYRACGNTDAKFCSRQCSLSRLNSRTPENLDVKRRAGKAGAAVVIQKYRGTGSKTYVKQNGRHQHRVVAEEMLGRPLLPGEVVHHINHDKHDNRPENLHVFASQAEHAAHHAKERHAAD